MPSTQDLKALRNMIAEAKKLIETAPELPEGRSDRALELLEDALALANHFLTSESARR